MKTLLAIMVMFLFLFVQGSFLIEKELKVCGRVFNQKSASVFLKDEGIKTKMIQVTDKITGRPAFGYFISAVRNDTNFIYSQLSFSGDTIITKTYRNYKITNGIDSSINHFICRKKGLQFYRHQSFWNGEKTTDTFHNLMLVIY